MGIHLTDKETHTILSSLGFTPTVTKEAIAVTVPSFRRDVTIDVDIIEELARLYGYHNIQTKLPEGEPPVVYSDPILAWEEEIKVRLRDWGYTETYTYSMISEGLMDTFGLDKTKAYKISNPLSSDWVYLRPTLWPSILTAVRENLSHHVDLALFELSMIYRWRQGNLPNESPILLVAWTGEKFFEAKGLAEELLSLFGIPFPNTSADNQPLDWYRPMHHFSLGAYGSLGEVNPTLSEKLGIKIPVTILDIDIRAMVSNAQPIKPYRPIPKYPPVVEDLAFTVPAGFTVGPLMAAFKKVHPLVSEVTLLDMYKDTRTFHIAYMDLKKNLTNEDVVPIHQKLISRALELGAVLRS